MRKIILSTILVCMLLLSSVYIIAGKDQQHYQKEMTYEFTQLTQIDKGEYISLSLTNAESSFIQDNHYIIPTSVKTYTFPLGTTIDSIQVTPITINELVIEKQLQIAPTPALHSSDPQEKVNNNQINPQVIDEWYHYDVGSGIYNGERQIIVKIELFPVHYTPQTNTVKWVESMQIDIAYHLSSLPQVSSADESYDLIVLAPSDFTGELNNLITHKISRGINATLVTLSDIKSGIYFPPDGRDDEEIVKYFIKNAIEQWNTRYVLLVGGADQFPTRYTHVYVSYGSGDAEVFASDLYFADIYDENNDFCSWDSNENNLFGEYQWGSERLTDEVDILPDVYLGRLACVNNNEVAIVVNKIIKYENQESYKKEWFSNMVLCGGDTFPGDSQTIDEGEYLCGVVENVMTGFSSNPLYVSNGNLRTTTDIADGVSDGGGFFILAGHANPSSWSTHPHENEKIWIPTSGFRNAHAASLNNGDKLPILLTESCSPFKFPSIDDCLGWSFISNPTGGAIAGFGCTGLSWGSGGSGVVSSLTGKLLVDTVKAYKYDGAITVGEMWGRGINRYYKPYLDGGGHKSVEEWQLFGDPSLSISEDSLAPLKPSQPNGPSSGTAGETYIYSAVTSDPEGDDIYYLFDWGDGTDSGWIGPYSSSKECEIEHIWRSDGSYEVRVKAQDFHGVVSEWSDPLTVSMPKNRIVHHTFIELILQYFALLQNLFQ